MQRAAATCSTLRPASSRCHCELSAAASPCPAPPGTCPALQPACASHRGHAALAAAICLAPQPSCLPLRRLVRPTTRLRARPASQLPTRRGGRLSPHVASDSAPRVAAACSALPLTRLASRPRARRCRRHASRRSHSRDVATDSRLSSHLRAGHYNWHTSRRSSLSAATGHKLGAAAGPRLAARPCARQFGWLAPHVAATRLALRLAQASRRRHSLSGAADSFRASRLRGQRNH